MECVLCGKEHEALLHTPFCGKCCEVTLAEPTIFDDLLEEDLISQQEHTAFLWIVKNHTGALSVHWGQRHQHQSKTIAVVWETEESPPGDLASAVFIDQARLKPVHFGINDIEGAAHQGQVLFFGHGRVLRSKRHSPDEATNILAKRCQEARERAKK